MKKIIIIVVVLIAVASIAYGGIVFFNKQPSSITQIPDESSTSNAVDTSSWKTHTDSEYHFSFKYPAPYNVQVDKPFQYLKKINITPDVSYDEEMGITIEKTATLKTELKNGLDEGYCTDDVDDLQITSYQTESWDCGEEGQGTRSYIIALSPAVSISFNIRNIKVDGVIKEIPRTIIEAIINSLIIS